MDGTLVDTREDIARAANHMLEVMGAGKLPPEEIWRYVGAGLHHLIGSCLKTGDEKKIEKGSKIYRRHYGEHMMDHSRLYPGASEILEYFKSRRQMVITNKPNPFSKDLLHALGVGGYFFEIVAGDSAYPQKPSPDAILRTLQRESIALSETLMVGDSLIDIETARGAGIEIVILSHGFSSRNELESVSPDAIVRDFPELLKLAKKKGW